MNLFKLYYELFGYIDLGIVHQGTLGLEMLCSKIPIAVVGSAYYSLLDAVTVIGSIENYKDIIFERKKISVSNMNEVNLFAYFYFIKCSMPWTLTSTAYAHDFKGYSFDNIERLKVGSDKYLDHLCNCILDSDNTIMENW